jgi:hypothetical protein
LAHAQPLSAGGSAWRLEIPEGSGARVSIRHEYDPRERGDLSKKQPDLLAELRALWEDWDRGMLPLPTEAVVPVSNLSAMLW